MTTPQVHQVPWSTFVGGFFSKLLQEVFCSAAWLKACVVKVTTENGLKVQVDTDHYPPGGKNGTGMLYCSTCRRWAPHPWGVDCLRQANASVTECIDCVTEAQSAAFSQHLEDFSDKSFAWELLQLSWKTGSARYLIEESDQEYSDTWENYDANAGKIEYGYQLIKCDYWDMFDRHYRWVGKDTNTDLQFDELLEELSTFGIAERQRRFSRRSLGCQSILLNEDETSLLEEITYYQNTQNLLPSVTRNNVNRLFE